jgi:hypothetical protein
MSGAKHTPGPWTTHAGLHGQIYVRGPHHVEVAMISEVASSEPLHRVSRVQAEANAHLIAAIPRVLEALEAMVQAQPCDCVVEGAGCPTCEALEALAAAHGEEVEP